MERTCGPRQNLEQCKNKTRDGGETKNSVAGSPDTLDGQLTGSVPHQVSETVPEVEGEGSSGNKLETDLGSNGESTKSRGDGGSVNGDTGKGQKDVRESTQVEDTAKSDTSDSVQTRKDHGDFGLVDSQVGGDGSVGALLLEDLKGLSISGGDGGERSVYKVLD